MYYLLFFSSCLSISQCQFLSLSIPHSSHLLDSATKTERAALLSQCLLLQYLEPHPHLVKMLGCCITDHIIALVLEICNLGNLRDFLIRNKGKYQVYKYQCHVMIL